MKREKVEEAEDALEDRKQSAPSFPVFLTLLSLVLEKVENKKTAGKSITFLWKRNANVSMASVETETVMDHLNKDTQRMALVSQT